MAVIAGLAVMLGAGTRITRADTAAPQAGAGAEEITEIIVTAERRSESIMAVPVSMTAFTPEALRSLQIEQPIDLVGHVAGLQAANTSGDGFPIYSIRGVSMNDYSPSQSAPVAVYANGVFASGPMFMANQTFDLARIEVLRGPQGTLYGRNATGGAVNFIAAVPDFTTSGYVTARAGNFNRFALDGAMQTALSDTLALRLALDYERADGYVRDTLTGQRFGGVRQIGGRLTLLYRPSDAVEATFRATWGQSGPAPAAVATRGLGDDGFDNRTTRALDTSVLGPSRNDGQTSQASLELLVHATPVLDVVSISSYGRGSFGLVEDADQSPGVVLADGGMPRAHQVAEDLRVQSVGDAPVKYIAGLYGAKDHLDWSYRYLYFQDVDFNGDGVLNYLDCYPPGFNCITANSFKQDRSSYAAYADGTAPLGGAFDLRAGLRYTRDTLEVSDYNATYFGPDLVPVFNAIPGSATDFNAVAPPMSKNWSNVTGRLGLDAHLKGGGLAYATISTGYRGGSFNAQAFNGPDELTAAEPEKLTAVEFGVKGHGLDRKLIYTAEAFYYRYRNQQALNVLPNLHQTEVNLARSHLYGAELEVTYRAAAALRLGANLSLLRTHVDEATVSSVDIAGNELQLAPKFSASANMTWTAYTGDNGKLNLFLEGTYVGSQWMDLFNTASVASPAHTVLNARLIHEFSHAPLTVGAWARNLTDKRYVTSGVDVSSLGFQYFRLGAPRTFGVEVGYKF